MAKNETRPENGEKMVKVRLFKGDLPQNRLPVDVWINGEHFVVPRGKEVEVPESVAEVLNHSEEAKQESDVFNEEMENVQYN